MSEYIVSARKYRPQTFDTVVGQAHITTTLKNAIKNQHLAHAFLFCGPRGVGKTTCARILAKTINCLHPTEDMEACGTCDICTGFKNNTSFNVFELDAASNNSVDDIRELTSQVRFAPQHGKYKVYIIDEVHMLSASAFNAFLKMLEEPPSYAIFILATTEKHKILPTILSRCQIFEFKRITNADIVGHLSSIAVKESMIAQEAALHVIAQKSEGCMRDALSMLDRIASFTDGKLTYDSTMEHLNLLDANFYFGLTDLLLSQDVAGSLLMLDKALEKGFEGNVVIEGMAEHLRNMLLCKDSRMVKLLDVPNDHKPVYFEKANQCPPSFILTSLNVINQCELEYKNANNKRLHTEMCLIRLCYVQQTVTGLGDAAQGDEKKNSDRVAPPLSSVPQAEQKRVETQAPSMPVVAAPPPPAPVHVPTPPVQQASPATFPNPEATTPVATARASISMGGGARLSRNLLADLDQRIVIDEDTQRKALTFDEATVIFKDYMQRISNENKQSIYAQLLSMKLEVEESDLVCIVSPSELTDSYAREHRSALLDLYRERMGYPIRITTKIVENKDDSEADKVRVLSKSEIYEVMARKNPMIAKLREVMNLQVEL